MPNLQVNFDLGFNLTYEIVDCESSRFFLDSIQLVRPDDICPTSIKNGFASDELINSQTKRLYEVANYINSIFPNEVQIVPLDPDWKLALQMMHTHFPDLTSRLGGPELQTITPSLGEFNDLIHWLDKELERKHRGNVLNKTWATLCLDFNRSDRCQHRPIPNEDYSLFTHELYFGGLHLHYDNVGRHPWELFSSSDYHCPVDQVISQNQISASCNLYFNDWDLLRKTKQVQSLAQYQLKFNKFYHDRGGIDFFKYALDDLRLAVGYMKIGQLENLADYSTVDARSALRNKLAQSKIVSWTVW